MSAFTDVEIYGCSVLSPECVEDATCIDLEVGAKCACPEGQQGDGLKEGSRCGYPPCPANMIGVGTTCYIPVNNTDDPKKPFDEAKKECHRLGGEVSSVNRTDVADGLETLRAMALQMGFHKIWIGLSDSKLEGYFVWEDGSFGDLPGLNLSQNTKENNCVSMESFSKVLAIEPCDRDYNFICSSPLYKKVCDEGYQEVNGSCFAVSRKNVTYSVAYMICAQNGGDLVSVHSSEFHSELNTLLFQTGITESWFGLQQGYITTVEPGYSDSTPVDYLPADFQFSNASRVCYTVMATGQWMARDCDAGVGAFICRRAPDVVKTCPRESVRFGDHCYKIKETTPNDWHHVRKVCLDMGGDLLSIKSPAQQAFVQDLLERKDANTDYWIALSETGIDGEFKWTDNTTLAEVAYSNWGGNQPDDESNTYNCVRMLSGQNYMWDDWLCEEHLPFICEYKNTPCLEKATCHSQGECSKGQCRCLPGYQGDGQKVCVDINECEWNPCVEHASCVNFEGGHNCTCNEGYEWNGVICINILACTSNASCHINALCNQDDLLCECKNGYRGDGKKECVDIDECAEELDECHQQAICINQNGTYECECKDGYYGDGFECVGTPKDCHELLVRNPTKRSGNYIIDPDGAGGVAAFKVYCEIKNGIGITIIKHNINGERHVWLQPEPKSKHYVFKYNNIQTIEQSRTLVSISQFCYQKIRFRCKGGTLLDTTYYEDANGTQHDTNMCPCGTIGACAEETKSRRCNCDGSTVTEQKEFIMVTKEHASMPLTRIVSGGTFPSIDIWFKITPLYCGPKQIGVPKDCHDAKYNYLHQTNNVLAIDPDGPEGSNPPFLAYCRNLDFKHVGVTEIPTQGVPGPHNPGPDGPENPITYPVDITHIPPLTSGFCMQKLDYTCQSSPLGLSRGSGFSGPSGTEHSYWGSALGEQEMCACGVLGQCADMENSDVACDCDAMEEGTSHDFGYVIDGSELPITSVNLTAEGGNRTYEVGRLACAPHQFGVPQSCQHIRMEGQTYSYTYLVDPDGPGTNNIQPFLVYCEMEDKPPVGCAIVSSDGSVQTKAQYNAIKSRSTYCEDLGNNTERCCELFQSCEHMWNGYSYIWGEYDLKDGAYVIDPDLAHGEDPFEVLCEFPLKTIVPVAVGKTTTIDSNTAGDPTDHIGPGALCTNIVYENANTAQLRGLADVSGFCKQDTTYDCRRASFTDNLRWKDREGDWTEGWGGANGEAECACGTLDMCDGGPGDACHCDQESPDLMTDSGPLIDKDILPISQVCLGYSNQTDYSGQNRAYAKYILGSFICAPRHYDIRKTCQDMRDKRQSADGVFLMDPDGTLPTQPFPVYCDMTYDPPIGESIITHKHGDDEIPIPVDGGTIDITYNSATLEEMKALIDASVYCKQELYYHCSEAMLDLNATAGYGLYGRDGKRLNYWAGNTGGVDCSEDECFCNRLLAGSQDGGLVTDKNVLPITRIQLGPVTEGGSRHLTVGPLRCFTLYKDCHEIYTTNNKHNPLRNNRYAIDTDYVGPLEPFSVLCQFPWGSGMGITKATRTQPFSWAIAGEEPASRIPVVTYYKASHEQLDGLVDISTFCRQRMEYVSRGIPLLNIGGPIYASFVGGHLDFLSHSWAGADDYPDVEGCACAVTGTCPGNATCRSDVTNPYSEKGYLLNKDYMPVKEVTFGGKVAGTSGELWVNDLQCAPKVFDFKKNCEIYRQNGWKTGEIQLWPESSVHPFTAYCDMDMVRNTGVTIFNPVESEVRVNDGFINIEYRGATHEQVKALVNTYKYCYQPVKMMCQNTEFIGTNPLANYWSSVSDSQVTYWGHGNTNKHMCRCGVDGKCGGHDGKQAMENRKCNCDIGDRQQRADAGILSHRDDLPLTSLTVNMAAHANASVILKTGKVYCSNKPIDLDECDLDFHDCHELAECVKQPRRYDCQCKQGFQGLGRPDVYANGRECYDDDECALQLCPPTADCKNTFGSYECHCREGFKQAGPYTCTDLDECALDTHDCDDNAHCTNTFGSYKCACNQGYRGTGRRGECESVGTCTCWGDPHCLSFDDKILHFQGACSYLMARDGCEEGVATSQPAFQVIAKFWRDYMVTESRVSWVKEVDVIIQGHQLTLTQGGRVLHNGRAVNKLPSRPILDEDITVRMVGKFVVVAWIPAGIEVKWSGTTQVSVVVPSRYQSNMCGLCGNYNDLQGDDWRLGPMCTQENGQNYTDNPNTFGASWLQANDGEETAEEYADCEADCERPPEPECDPDDEAMAEIECNRLYDMEGPFAACLAKMDPITITNMFQSCKYDICRLEEIEQPYCDSAQYLSSVCQQEYKITINQWRKDECPLVCSEGQEYKVCGNPCQQTCADLDDEYLCSYDCVETCECPDGKVLEGDKCVLPGDCGCYVDGVSYSLGDRIVKEDCSEECYCRTRGSNQLECNNIECDDDARCSQVEGVEDCRCNDGYRGDGQSCEDVDECEEEIDACDENARCVNTIGSHTCHCKHGWTGDGKTCKDVNECTEYTDPCMEHATCFNTPGDFECNCNTGYQKVDEVCKDVDECETGRHNCDLVKSDCHNTPGAYSCLCKQGYRVVHPNSFAAIASTLTGRVICQDNDECIKTAICDGNATCDNYPGSYDCKCEPGYEGSGEPGSCKDVDECSHELRNNCHEKADCTNTEGSFECKCKLGYEGDGVEVCEGEDPPPCGEECVRNAECVAVTAELSECKCKKGFTEVMIGDIVICRDINECEESETEKCGHNAVCTNTEGSYTCTCKTGYTGDGITCEDEDECQTQQPCDKNAICENTVGSYTCTCIDGFQGDGKSCDNVDECLQKTHNCVENAHCVDTIGAFNCSCNTGYSGHCDECKDINECTSGTHKCHLVRAECTNTQGSYTCTCKEGYTGTGTSCFDINECELGTHNCDPLSKCLNIIGSYFCLCNHGYVKDENGHCKDKDECSSSDNYCHHDAICTNLEGSYKCECKTGYIGDGFYCQDNSTDGCDEGCGENEDCLQMAEDTFECRCRHGYQRTAEGNCKEINPCDNMYCDIHAECEVMYGYPRCICQGNYYGNGLTCKQPDPCSKVDLCGDHTECITNLDGTFTCACEGPGFEPLDQFSCDDIDECGADGEICPLNSLCVNTEGSYHCDCESGFRKTHVNDTIVCEDIDECLEESHNCDTEDDRAVCINTDGAYECKCNHPYKGNGIYCYEENEPDCHKDCEDDQYCKINSTSGEECACHQGYEPLSYDPLTCEDINECLDKHGCHDKAECVNQEPGYICDCVEGYYGNGRVCEDIDECDGENDCHDDAECTNEDGYYNCSCQTGFEGDGFVCTLIPSEEDICGCGPNGTCSSRSLKCECIGGYLPDYSRDTDKCQDVDECAEGNNCHETAICVNLDGGYTCVCPEGQRGNGFFLCDENECDTGNNDCHDKAYCVDTFGLYKCFCKDGYTGDGFNCTKITDPCAEQGVDCGENAFCVGKDGGNYRCECKGGYKGDGEDCEDINECNEKGEYKHECDENAVCYNTIGAYICRCKPGFKGSGKSCEDINECEESESGESSRCSGQSDCQNSVGGFSCTCKPGLDGDGQQCKPVVACGGGCGENAACESTSSGGHVCVCDDGFEGNPYAGCTDIDECEGETGICSQDADCENEEGTYTCTCKEGYQEDGETCIDIDECLEDTDNDCEGEHVNCVNTPGSYHCHCAPGYRGNATECTDIDECEENSDECNEHGDCENTPGGYKCVCKEGYYGDGITCISCNGTCDKCEEGYIFNGEFCEGVNECILEEHSQYADLCVNADCDDTPTGYICNCKGGYARRDDLTCEDKNECEEPTSCGDNGKCINTPGSFVCKCFDGFVWTDDGCEDINECEGVNVCGQPASSTCENTEGGFTCTCRTGYEMVGDKCEDVDECVTKTAICGVEALCINVPGHYECQCSTGYDITYDYLCEDINECEGKNGCDMNANCENTEGSYTCTCHLGFIGDGYYCTPICGPDICSDQATCTVVAGMPECECRCDEPECEVEGEVCGTDGQTYSSHTTLVMTACENKRKVTTAYRGQCQISCEDTQCSHYKSCEIGDNSLPMCVCPDCTEEDFDSGPFCTVENEYHPHMCSLKMTECYLDGDDVVAYPGQCNHPINCEFNQWQPWSSCSQTCGRGTKTRSRTIKREAEKGGISCYRYQTTQTTHCDKPACKGDVCYGWPCTKSHSFCAIENLQPKCVCPDCIYEKTEHLCVFIGEVQKTMPNLCKAKKEACELDTTLSVVHPGHCGVNDTSDPLHCTVMPKYTMYTDPNNNCTTTETVQVNTCLGGCGKQLGYCCEPKQYRTLHKMFTCPNGNRKSGKVKQVLSCFCVPDVRQQVVEGDEQIP